jgi:hypothetical protein
MTLASHSNPRSRWRRGKWTFAERYAQETKDELIAHAVDRPWPQGTLTRLAAAIRSAPGRTLVNATTTPFGDASVLAFAVKRRPAE